jgi:hypothetical protein
VLSTKKGVAGNGRASVPSLTASVARADLLPRSPPPPVSSPTTPSLTVSLPSVSRAGGCTRNTIAATLGSTPSCRKHDATPTTSPLIAASTSVELGHLWGTSMLARHQ